MEKLVFFIYTVLQSDNRYDSTSKSHVYSTLFLISFFQLFIFLPLLLILNDVLHLVSLEDFLSLPILLRYLIIFGVIVLIGLVNFYFLARENRMERIIEKHADKKEQCLKHKWLLVVFAAILGILVIGSIGFLRTI